MRFAICQELFENWDWERQCRAIADIGYQGIEVAPFTLAPRITDVSSQQRQRLRKQAEDCGLEIIGLHWLLAKTNGLHLTSAEPAVRAATGQYLADLAQACADFGGRVLVFGSPAQRNLDEHTSPAQGLDRAAEVIRAALPTLIERDVLLCLEPLSPADTNFLNTCDQAVELTERIGDPHVCLHQDVKAMLSEPTPIPELIRAHASRVGHFHVNDSNLLGPGMGETDFEPIFRALDEVGYSGWVSVEVFDYAPGAEHIARTSLDYMRALRTKIDADAR